MLSMMSVCNAFGQHKISGKLTTEAGAPVAAVVSLFAADTLASATLADAKGLFEFRELRSGNYLLTVAAADMQPVADSIALDANREVRYVLYPVSEIALGEVSVVADRSNVVQQTAGGAIFHLSASAKKATDAFAALNGIPSLVVDPTNRTVRMNSGAAPLILVNGVRTGNGLNGVDPADIESVEVIEVPSARYVSDGVTAVVNVRVARKQYAYRSLNAYSRHSVPVNFGVSGFNAETGDARRLTYLTGQHFYFTGDESRYLSSQQNDGYAKNSDMAGFYNSNSYYACLGGDFVFSAADYLSYSITYINNPSGTEREGKGELTSGDVRSAFDIATNSEADYYVNTYNAYHRHGFENKSLLETTFRLNFNGNGTSGETRETYDNRPQYHYAFDYDNYRTSSSLDLNYGFKWLGQSSNAGSATRFRKDRIHHISQPVFHYRELDEYLYVDASGQLNAHFSYMASVGADLIFNRSGDTDNSYYSPAASAAITYRANPYSTMRLSYLKSNESPDIGYMNPYNTSSDSLYVSVGNPSLRPVRRQRFTGMYTLNRSGIYLSPQISYLTVSGYIVPTGSNDGRVYTQTYMNDTRFGELDGALTLRYNSRHGSIGGSAGYRRTYFSNVDKGSFYTNVNFNAACRKVSVNGYVMYQRYRYTPLSTTKNYTPETEITFSWALTGIVTLQAGMRYFLGGIKSESTRDDRGYRTTGTQDMLDRRFLTTAGLSINLQNRIQKQHRTEKRLYQNESGIQLR
jgi:hypothetical protein